MATMSTPATGSFNEYAILEFEPIIPDPPPPSNSEWEPRSLGHLKSIRVAWSLVRQTKPELISSFKTLDEEAIAETAEGFLDSIEWFTAYLELLRPAQARTICVLSVIAT